MKRQIIPVLAGIIICILLLCGASPLNPQETYIGFYNGGQFRGMETIGGRIYATVGSTVWSFDRDGGSVASATCSGRMKTSHVAGGSAYFITDSGTSFDFEEHSVYGGLIRSRSSIIDSSLYGYVTAMTIDDDGNAWFIVKDKELWFCNSSTGESCMAYKFSKAVSDIYWVNSQLYAVCGSRVYFCEGRETVDASSYTELYSKPVRFFDGTVYVDRNGNFCSGGSLLFSTQIPDAGAVSHYSDGTYAYYLTGERSAVKTDLYGTIVEEYSTDGLICAVCDEGLLTVKDGKLYFASYASAPVPTPTPAATATPAPTAKPTDTVTPKPTSSPAPTKAPSDEDEGSEENLPDLPAEGEYLVIEAGSTITDITRKMNCEIWYQNGKVTSGLVRTGMVAKSGSREMPIVVMGDVNGSGTVNSADFRAIQDHLLETEKLKGAHYLAGDISGNGAVGTEDLVLILKKFQ